MKFYTTPELMLVDFEAADILTLSVADGAVNFGDDDIKIEF